MSKGSKRRPRQVLRDELDRRWEQTFGGIREEALTHEEAQAIAKEEVRRRPNRTPMDPSAPLLRIVSTSDVESEAGFWAKWRAG